MSTGDTDSTAVLDAVRGSLDGVVMSTPVSQIVAAGRAHRRRRRLIKSAGGLAAVTALALAVPALDRSSTAPPEKRLSPQAGSAHVTVAFTLASHTDGTIHVTWNKNRYFQDHAGLQRALRHAGFPVLIKEGVFCRGPRDDGSLDPSGVGPGVARVMKGERKGNDTVAFVFTPSAMPAGKQLFIGYLSPSQLAVTHGNPRSVERLVSTGVPLTCTTQAPEPNPR